MYSAKSQQMKRPRLYYGWLIVFVSAVGIFFSGPGQTYGISVFIDSYINDFGWSRSLVSGIYSSATLLSGLLLFVVGRSVDRFGQRKMAVSVGVLLAAACVWNSFAAGPIMIFFGFFMIRLFGQGSMTLIPNTLVPQWFIRKRGRALSMMAIGGFLSSAAFPPLNAWLIHSFGWQSAWRVLAVLLCIVFVPLAYFIIRNKPEDIGLLPDNDVIPEADAIDGQPLSAPVSEVNWTVKEAMRTRAFWLILFCVSLPALINTGLTFHLISIFKSHGLKATTAALILSLMAVIGFPVSFVAGFLLEKIQVHKVLAISFIGQMIFLVVLIRMSNISEAILFGVIWGAINGFERITLNIVWPNYFGRKHLGSIKGIAMTTMVIGSAFGPLPFGIAFDYFHSYYQILLIMMIFPVLGFFAAITSPPPEKN